MGRDLKTRGRRGCGHRSTGASGPGSGAARGACVLPVPCILSSRASGGSGAASSCSCPAVPGEGAERSLHAAPVGSESRLGLGCAPLRVPEWGSGRSRPGGFGAATPQPRLRGSRAWAGAVSPQPRGSECGWPSREEPSDLPRQTRCLQTVPADRSGRQPCRFPPLRARCRAGTRRDKGRRGRREKLGSN